MAQANTPKQYLFVSNRDITITSVHGYSIAFKRGEPIHVPKRIHGEVMEKGCIPCNEKGEPLPEPEETVNPEAKLMLAPDDVDERNSQIEKVMEEIVARNSPHDFSAGGVPSASAITAALGWRVDQKEVRPLWSKMKPKLLAKA